MTTPPSLFHALLHPSILQILRSTGYHSTRPAVLDSLTDMAARYLSLLCQMTASHALHNHGDTADFDIVDVRMALQDAGALLPERVVTQQEWQGVEDLRGVEEFIKWFAGQRMKEMMEFGNGDGESDATDYLNALKKKHSKAGDDAKYHGTVLGRDIDLAAEVQVEGGSETTITEWIIKRSGDARQATTLPPQQNGHLSPTSNPPRSPSSGLSSVGGRLDQEHAEHVGEKMDLS